MLIIEKRIIFRKTVKWDDVFFFLCVAGCCSNDMTDIVDIWAENKDIWEVTAAADDLLPAFVFIFLKLFFGFVQMRDFLHEAFFPYLSDVQIALRHHTGIIQVTFGIFMHQ